MRLRSSVVITLVIFAFVGSMAVVLSAQKSSTSEASSAEEAYAKLNEEISILERGAQKEKTIERRIAILEEIEAMLNEFMQEYPGTPEASDATFQLGLVNYTLQRTDRAITYLNEFVITTADEETDKQIYAHFFLAEAYKLAGDFTRAKDKYNLVIEKYHTVQPQIAERAKRSLANIEFEKKLAIGKEPIDFSVVGLKGEAISPSKYRGKVLLLDFWATWCGPCRREMPNVKRVYKKYKDKGFEIVGISLDRSRSDLDKYIASNEITWPQFFDGKFWQNDVAVKYRVQSIPATYLIGKQGKIRYKSLHGNKLETAVKELLAE